MLELEELRDDCEDDGEGGEEGGYKTSESYLLEPFSLLVAAAPLEKEFLREDRTE